MLAQAAVARASGFDGVTVSEHHAGYPGYLPNPVMVTAWVLEQHADIWAAPCPMLLSTRPSPHVIEDVAWVAARHPGRVGVAVAPGFVPADFAVPSLDFEGRRERFGRELPIVVRALRGDPPPALTGDRAIAFCAAQPVPVLATAETARGAARAARAGAGVVIAAHNSPAAAHEIFEGYRGAGGRGPRVLIRRVHLGSVSEAAWAGLAARYRSQAPAGKDLQLIQGDDAEALGETLISQLEASGASALNLRVNLGGETVDETREQIALLARAISRARSQIDVEDERLV